MLTNDLNNINISNLGMTISKMPESFVLNKDSYIPVVENGINKKVKASVIEDSLDIPMLTNSFDTNSEEIAAASTLTHILKTNQDRIDNKTNELSSDIINLNNKFNNNKEEVDGRLNNLDSKIDNLDLPDTNIDWENIINRPSIDELKGDDGDTPYVGTDGTWWIGNTSTGVIARGQDGKDGKDGINGQDGRPGEKGDKGDQGDKGDKGDQGPIGLTGPQGEQGIQGIQGDTGEGDIRSFGAIDSLSFDSTDSIQQAINYCYNNGKIVIIPNGNFQVTRAIYVPNGVSIHGTSKTLSLIRTPFRRKPKSYKTPEEKEKAEIALQNVELSKGKKYTATQGPMILDYTNGHNRFYLGDGIIGYYDADRELNPNHPYYYPEPPFSNVSTGEESKEHKEWIKWQQERTLIEQQGRFIGKTGRENYSLGLFKSTDHPELRHTTDKNSPSYLRHREGCLVHCGNRHTEFYNFKIQTNSEDRGKDTCINYNYSSSDLLGDLTVYDSSCLGHRFNGLWLFESGGSGISINRSVNTDIVNCLAQRIAVFGFYINGVTSTNITSCYANGCLEAGFRFEGTHYSSLQGCAADSCSKAYSFKNCTTITMIGCGYEALKLILADNLITDEGTIYSAIYPGKGIQIQNSSNMTIINPYGSTARNQFTVNTNEIDEQGIELITKRHVSIVNSKDINIISPNFKSYIRWRTAPFRELDNTQVPSFGRFWEFQDRSVDALFEVRNTNKAYITTTLSEKELLYENQDRTLNLDILDPGLVPHPDGLDTAFKTISGDDGNGGWLNLDNVKISVYDIEKLFPVKNKKNGPHDKYWNWRKSLLLVRKRYFGSLTQYPPEGLPENTDITFINGYGYLTMIERNELEYPVNWQNIDSIKFKGFLIDKELGFNYGQSYIDQSAIGNLIYSYPPLSLSRGEKSSELSQITLTGFVNAKSRNFENGVRSIYNDFNQETEHILKSAHGFNGNFNKETNHIEPIAAFRMPIRNSEYNGWDYPALTITDNINSELVKIYPSQKGVIGRGEGLNTNRMLSFNAADRAKITKLESGSSTTKIINRINNIIDRLRGHGLIIDGDAEINYTLIQIDILPINAIVLVDNEEPTNYTIEKNKKSYRINAVRNTKLNLSCSAEGYESYSTIIPVGSTAKTETIELIGNTEHTINIVTLPIDAIVKIKPENEDETIEGNSITRLIGTKLFITVTKEGYAQSILTHIIQKDETINITLNPTDLEI